MGIHMLFRMAFRAIRHHVVRSLLTLLGIVIGIAGIITISAVGKGTQKKARDQYLTYGSKAIDVSAGNWMTFVKKKPKPLTLDDMHNIMTQCPSVRCISPSISRYEFEIEYQGNTTSARIMGTNEQLLKISERQVQQGIFFTQYHVEYKENVVVLSPEATETLFKKQNPCGEIIRIDKIPFKVIGVLAKQKVKGKWDGLGRPSIYIPFSTHQKCFNSELNALSLCTYTNEQINEVTRQLEKIFRAAHVLEEGEPNDFMIFNLQAFAVAAEEASKSVGLFALLAALIALLVGGIGVMNIMLVAVKERTKEIGVKAALGAPMNFIRMQFLIEATVICIFGGIIGVICGIGASLILDRWMGILTILEITPILISFSCTILIGLIFGFYPAERAARLDPVQALTDY